MADGNWGVIIFLVLIVAFIVYIIAAAMRDRKKALPAEETDDDNDEAPVLPEGTVPAAQEPAYCYSCMAKLSGGETVCPACGKPTALMEKPGQLPVGLILADRYTLGLAVEENRSGITYLAADNYLETKHWLREYFPKDFVVRGEDGTEAATKPGAADSFAAGKKNFIRDIRLQSSLNGFSSAAGVTDLFYTNGTAYAVMEYAPGKPLTAFIAAQGKLSPEYTLALFAPVTRQLAKEQSLGLLRCNLTPDSFTVADGRLKLEGTGVPGGHLSTFLQPGFSPEELYRSSGTPGAWSDVYSLCAVMYWCMTGITPDAASDRVYKDDLRSPSSLGVYFGAGPEAGLMKGLSVYREDRPQDCGALFRDIYIGKKYATLAESFIRPIVDPLTEDLSDKGNLPLPEPEDNDI